ncbi:hypothetical protein TSUD_139290 [Trifolium subterraneum]|uniref:Uncharacterized protein n=1 Tax=Trifolium subterraneum TaxID=3900 RepID=A0A2Z6NKG6_TRISU|nr:hypothetical protein TSUD_139290 [Trifolium subterraneum]
MAESQGGDGSSGNRRGGSNASRGLDDAISADYLQICKCSANHTPAAAAAAAASNTIATKLQCICAAGILQQPICFHQQFHEHEQLRPWFLTSQWRRHLCQTA